MLSSDIRGITEAYRSIYDDNDLLNNDLLEEIIEEIFFECVEEGYNVDDAATTVEEAVIAYFDAEELSEATVTTGQGSRMAAASRLASMQAAKKIARQKERKEKVKSAVQTVKAKAAGAKAAAGIAGSIAKDEARRAGRAAKQAVVGAVEKKKQEVKSGVKSFIGRGLRKAAGAVGKVAQKASTAAARLGEETQQPKDIFDEVIEFLCVEGYAETLEDAEWMMANLIDEEAIDIILGEEYELDEAEGSYGQTPKARQAMGKLAIARREKPASEYSQKGEKTKKVKEIEKHTRRIDNGPDVGNRGKKSTKPRHSGFLGKSGRGKMDQDRRDYARDSAVEYTAGGHKPGPGTVTKNPKKLRKQKAMGESVNQSFEAWLDEAMTNYEKNRKRAAQRAAARNAARDQGKTGAVPGVGYVTPRRESEYWTDESGKKRHAKGL